MGKTPFALAVDMRTRRVFVKNTDGTVSVLDTARGTLVHVVHTEDDHYYPIAWDGPGVPIAVSANTGHVFVTNALGAAGPQRNGSVSMLDATRGTLLRTIITGAHPVATVADAHRGHIFVANYGAGSVSILDAATGNLLHTTHLGGAPNSLALDERLGRIFVTNNGLGIVSVLDIRTGAVVRTVHIAANAAVVDESTGRVFAASVAQPGSAGGDQTLPSVEPPGAVNNAVFMLDGATGKVLHTTHFRYRFAPGHMRALAVDQETGRVFVTNDGDVLMLDATSDAILAQIGVEAYPEAVAVDEQTGRAFVTHWDRISYQGSIQGPGGVSILDATSGRVLTIQPVSFAPLAVAVDEQADRAFVLNYFTSLAHATPGSVTVLDATAGGLTLAQRRNPTLRVAAACPPALYVPQSGHNLAGPFLAFWRQHGGVPVLGNPRTEAVSDQGTLVQYTDRFLLRQVGGQIQPAPLGRELTRGRSFARVAPFASTPARRYFPATGQSLSGGFLTYWLRHDGARLLGAPISAVITEGNGDGSGRRYPLQWFANGRLEYHAELAGTPYLWELGLLGVQALQRRGWLPHSS